MNRENIQKAIRVMERVRDQNYEFDMRNWQTPGDGIFLAAEKDAVACGTACCFAGWIAISPEFKGQLMVDSYGVPYIPEKVPQYIASSESAIAQVLGIPYREAYKLCGLADSATERGYTFSRAYQKAVSDITPEDVIKRLKGILEEENV